MTTFTTPEYQLGDVVNGHVLTEQGWVPAPAPRPETPKTKAAKKPIYKRWWALVLAAVFVIGGISVATGGGTEAEQPNPPGQSATQTVPDPEQPVVDRPAEPQLTPGQENALRAAENYLATMPFSRAGLIEQLSSEYGEGYSVADATFAADHVEVDWKEQAARAAKSYLETMPFSRDGLIEQLSSEYGDGFTRAQAIYGVNQAGL